MSGRGGHEARHTPHGQTYSPGRLPAPKLGRGGAVSGLVTNHALQDVATCHILRWQAREVTLEMVHHLVFRLAQESLARPIPQHAHGRSQRHG